MKVNGKPQILGTRSPQTSESIDLKFDLHDYVGGLTLCARQKWYKSAQWGQWGKGVKYNVQLGHFSFFFTFLAKLWRTHFWEYRRIFLHWVTCFGVPRGSQHSPFIFSPLIPPKPQILGPFSDLKNYDWKCLTVEMLIYKLPLIVIVASPKWHSE